MYWKKSRKSKKRPLTNNNNCGKMNVSNKQEQKMKQQKWETRDKKRNKAKNGMRVVGASIKLLEQIKNDKAKAVANG